MIGKYAYMDPKLAEQLLLQLPSIHSAKHGIDRHAYLFDEHAVLSTNRLKLRNVDTRDDELIYLDEIITSLYDLSGKGVSVVPILGYCFDPESEDGTGYIFQSRAKGNELFDDAVLAKFQVWAQKDPENIYLQCPLTKTEAIDYLLTRTEEISRIPQTHFDKFIADMICILEKDILIDSNGKSNFFYDENIGFQFIDLDSHHDFRYGLTDQKPSVDKVVSVCGFVPCHYRAGSKIYAFSALDECAISDLTQQQRKDLSENNLIIFDKCVAALRTNGVPEECIHKTLTQLKIFGL